MKMWDLEPPLHELFTLHDPFSTVAVAFLVLFNNAGVEGDKTLTVLAFCGPRHVVRSDQVSIKDDRMPKAFPTNRARVGSPIFGMKYGGVIYQITIHLADEPAMARVPLDETGLLLLRVLPRSSRLGEIFKDAFILQPLLLKELFASPFFFGRVREV